MKFSCGDRKRKKFEYMTNWHPVFALWPVKVADNDCRWLETVYAKNYAFSWGEYSRFTIDYLSKEEYAKLNE